jgi:excisionase family DNA binding protein
MQTVAQKRALRVSEAAEMLSVSRWLLYRAVLSGRVKAVRLGPRSMRIPADEVERLAREGFDAAAGDEVAR